jgi:hypothetical protein
MTFSKTRIEKKKELREEDFLANYDIFAKEMPGFTLKGKHEVGTWIGFIWTVGLIILMIFYGYLKLNEVLLRENPSLNLLTEDGFYDWSY